MYVLETRQVTKSFGEGETRVDALRGVDIGVPPGEMLAIMGRSGSGKSTLLTLLGGVDVPTTGQVLLEGVDLATLNDDQRTLIRRRRIGFVFQSFNLLPILTAEENVALPLELDGVPAASRPKSGRWPSWSWWAWLSAAAICRARCRAASSSGWRSPGPWPSSPPSCWPTSRRATSTRANGKRITTVLRELVDKHGQTLILVTHDPAVAAQADRVIYLADGLVEREETNRVVPVRPRRVVSEQQA